MISARMKFVRAKLLISIVGSVLLAVGCGGHQSVAPLPPIQQPQNQGIPGAPDISADDQENIGPLVTVTAKVVITVPSSASAAKSASISVNGGSPVIANITSGSAGCTGTNPVVCTESVSAPTSADTFALKTFNATNGTGTQLASGSLLQTITTTSLTVQVALAGTAHSIVLKLKTTGPRECNPSTKIPLFAMVEDSSGNTIIGAWGVTVALKDSDASGTTSLSSTSASNSSTALTLTYNGHPLQAATISASATGVASVTDATLDPLQMIYTSNYYGGGIVTVYPSNANGNIAPVRSISGAKTTLTIGLEGAAVDKSCNLTIVDNDNNDLLVFPPDASGDVAPTRTISGVNTKISNPQLIATDASGNVWLANASGSQILEFAAGANGNVAPIKDITGASTGLANPCGVSVASTGKIYVGNTSNVLVFASGANGNVAPTATITDSTTPFAKACGVTTDSTGKIYVANANDGNPAMSNVDVFAATANGSSIPLQAIQGTNTGFSQPQGIAVDYAGDIVVSDLSNSDLFVFAKGSTGNIKPKRTIAGGSTMLTNPWGIAL